METKRFARGDVIIRQGDMPAFLYDIHSGAVGIYAEQGTADETHITTFGPGQVFGEMELIASCPRSATAVALEDTAVHALTQQDFSAYFADKPEKVLSIMRQVSQRVRETTDDYLAACRTVYDAVEAEQEGQPKPPTLLERLNFFAKVGALLGK